MAMEHSTTGELDAARELLQRIFGHEDFVGRQADVIGEALAGRDVLAIMPTGGGKSLCYQIPALMRAGTAVVVSPLIALMKDQVDALRQHGVSAACLNSALSSEEIKSVYRQFFAGELDLLYVSPERLVLDSCLDMLRQKPLALFAIDEAHCVSQWGHDFRPDYMDLAQLADEFPGVPRLALTATADERTRKEIVDKLRLQDPEQILGGFDRPNIRYHIKSKRETRTQFMSFYNANHRGESGIVYCMSRRRTEETAAWLELQGLRALPYHAGMDKETRNKHQEIFVRDEGVIIVATVAFGMGIDKPDVRFVAHFDMPKSVEGYYQETGRAGRDGLDSEALLFYGLSDAIRVRQMVDEGGAPDAVKRVERQKVNALLGLCETVRCRREVLLGFFGEEYRGPCNNCDNCLHPPQEWDGTVAAQKFLSCMVRVREHFGTAHVIDVLLGKPTPKVEKFGHQSLTTFGIGNELSLGEWNTVARQLVAAGCVVADSSRFGALRLTPEAAPILRGDQTISFRRELPRATQKVGKTAREPVSTELLSEEQRALFDALRAERRRLAAAQNVPAYVIFHDSTLLQMALRQPQTATEFADLPGVGAAKVERYFEPFLRVIQGGGTANPNP